MIKVKICGITNYQDAALAVELGADALGFIFAPSPRRITPEMARGIIRTIAPFVQTVGVFVNERTDVMRQVVGFCGLDLVQLHGDEPVDLCNEFMPRTIKVFRVKDESCLESVRSYRGNVRAVLLDAYSRDKWGGTGKTFDWGLAVMSKEIGIPVILAGGLTTVNIEEAISEVNPYAVDINSGIEVRPGKKDHHLMRELMEKIRRTDKRGGLNE